MVYQYGGPPKTATAPFAVADEKSPFFPCVDERQSATWPFTPITGATFIDPPKVALTGPGINGTLNITKSNPPNTSGNSTFRHYDFTYGGGAPGMPPMGFNGTLTAASSTPDSDYTLDIGEGTPMTYHIPEAYTAPLGIGNADPVKITAHQALEYSWTTPANTPGTDHLPKTYFNITVFADPTAANPPLFICFPDKPGHQTVPVAVIDALPAGGLVVNANLTHYMEARTLPSGEKRRFDLVGIYCNVSLFAKQ
jgi:hypothetical protein